MLISLKDLMSKYNFQPTGVLHFGANNLSELPIYKECGISTMVFVDALGEVMWEGARKYRDEIFDVIVACLSDVDDEEVMFNIANNGGQSSSILKFGTHTALHPQVRFIEYRSMITTRFDSWLKRASKEFSESVSRCDLLNCDLQGADLKAIKGMGDLLNQFKYIYVECNKEEVYQGCDLFDNVVEYLGGFGFVPKEGHFFKGADGREAWGDYLFIKE